MGVIICGKTLTSTSCQITHEPSGANIITTAPKDNGGDGSHFSPTDLCASAMGSCAATIMAMAAQKQNIPLNEITFKVEKIMSPSPRKIAELKCTYIIHSNCSDNDFAKLIKAGKECPIRLTLAGAVQVTEEFLRA